MSEIAWLVHRLHGRVRLRVPQRRKDRVFFAALIEQLEAWPATAGVQANVITGSVLLQFEDGPGMLGQLEEILQRQGLVLQIGDPPMVAARPAIKEGMQRLDRYVGMASQQATDLRSLGVLFFFSLSVLQVARGQVLAPATSLLWYALDLLRDPTGESSDE